jgi:hypothetical protein
VIAYETENPGTYKAFVEDGEINFTRFYETNSGGAASAEIEIAPDCELALMVIFNSDDYEYKSIREIYVVQFDVNNRDQFTTQVSDYGGGVSQITLYIPLAYVYLDGPPESQTPRVRQYFCGNLEFRMYYTTINGAPAFEFFKTIGISPGLIPATEFLE